MASTASNSLKLRKQGTGDNLNTWGGLLNTDVIDLIDEAVAQQVTISLTGNHTLTSTNYATNEARQSYLKFTDGGLGSVPTVTAPSIEKWWWIKNAGSTYAITFGVSGGTSVSIPAGKMAAVFSDGTDCEIYFPEPSDLKAPTSAFDMNSQKITSLADPTSAQDAATKNYIDTLAASGDLATVAGIASEITTVAAVDTEITTVAGISANVTTVAGISGNVTTVAGISANVTAVANDATDIGTVATNIANVNTAATNIADINTVAGDATDIGTVAGISANVTTVAGDSADIQALAAITANITTVAGISANVTTVANDATDIGTVSANIADVNTCATNIADIQNAASLFGDVLQGPGSSTDNYIPQWDGTGGDTLKAGLAVGTSANNLVQLNASAKLKASIYDFASQAEAEAGTDTNKPLNSLRVSQAVSALAGGGLTLISEQTLSNVASASITSGIDSTYDEYELHLINIEPASSSRLFMRFGDTGGFHTSAYRYATMYTEADDTSVSHSNSTSSAEISLAPTNVENATEGPAWSGVIKLFQPSISTRYEHITFEGSYGEGSSGSIYPVILKGVANHNDGGANITDRVQIYFGTGNISAGEMKLYGVKKS